MIKLILTMKNKRKQILAVIEEGKIKRIKIKLLITNMEIKPEVSRIKISKWAIQIQKMNKTSNQMEKLWEITNWIINQ